MRQEELNQDWLIEETLHQLGWEIHPATNDGAVTAQPADRAVGDGERPSAELLGLLAYQLEPETPSPVLRERLMAAVGEQAVRGAAVRGADQPAPATLGELVGGQQRFAARPAAPSGRGERRFNGLTLALAAMLALCLVGLGYLLGQDGEQRRTIARLDQQIAGYSDDIRSVSNVLDQLNMVEHKFDMVTRVARTAYPMETVGPIDPGAPRPDGMIYVCGQHQRWYLNVDGLEPPPPDKEYWLWFLTDKGPISGGVIEVEPGVVAEKEAKNMPPGTRGFSITLEDAGHESDHPEGIAVLLAEDSVSL